MSNLSAIIVYADLAGLSLCAVIVALLWATKPKRPTFKDSPWT